MSTGSMGLLPAGHPLSMHALKNPESSERIAYYPG